MQTFMRLLQIAVLLFISNPAVASSQANWIDALSLTLGTDDNSNETDLIRIGFQNQWERSWFEGGAWFVSGYWDTELGYLQSDYGSHDELLDVSLTPVLRLQRDASLSSGVTPYAEAGIGAHLLSDTRLGEQAFSTAFQFGSHLGVGLGFGERGQYELSYRFQHISNMGIKEPNDGLELHLLRLGYSFP